LAAPKKHHYIPQFLLKRWARTDGQLVEFQRQYRGIVKPRQVFPAMTGYIENLYAMRDFKPNEAQQIESLFLQPVDTQASEALKYLERGVSKSRWPDDLVSAWSRFLISLLIRMPEDINVLRRRWRSAFLDVTPEQEETYKSLRSSSDPETMLAFLSNQPEWYLEKATFESFITAHNSEKIGQLLNNMYWEVVDLSASRHELYLSDRPTIRTSALIASNGHIAVPISPELLFLSANSQETIRSISKADPTQIAEECNAQIVGAAVRFAYATSDKCLRYMQNRLGTAPQHRILS
jgi:Protein of unknown function (DUF4238)